MPFRDFEHRGRTIRCEIRTRATPQEAWAAWTDPLKIASWFVDHAAGKAKEGEEVTWGWEKFAHGLTYRVLASIPGEQFTLGFGKGVGSSEWAGRSGILDIRIQRDGDETVVRLVNSGFSEEAQWDEEYNGVDSGWRGALALLRLYLDRYYGEPRSTFSVFRPADLSYPAVIECATQAGRLAQWLGQSSGIGHPGDAYQIRFFNGSTASGHVLERSEREVALTWEEIRGTLTIGAFGDGPEKRTIKIAGCGWQLSREKAREIEATMSQAAGRLAALVASHAAALS